jgi:hypothetical protein
MPGLIELFSRSGVPAPQGPQRIMGAAFLVMGGACVVLPRFVIRHGFTDAAKRPDAETNPLVRVLMQCFGAQAMLAGTMLCVSKLDRRGYAIWGAAMVPFVVFDYVFWQRGMLTDLGALGDLAGNILFLTSSAVGAGLLAFGASGVAKP